MVFSITESSPKDKDLEVLVDEVNMCTQSPESQTSQAAS